MPRLGAPSKPPRARSRRRGPDVYAIFDRVDDVAAAFRRAVGHALRDHKAKGNPIVVCHNARVVEIPADDIVIEEE